MNRADIKILKKQFELDLPGEKAQIKMSPIKEFQKYGAPPESFKVACVLALIHPKQEELYITFIKRASGHPDDKHAGQIGFPGGKIEKEDKSLEMCALRETEEEIGVLSADIEILGALTPLYVFASNFMVYPFVGYLDYTPKYVPQEKEVAGIYEMSLQHLMDPMYKVSREVRLSEGFSREAPGYSVDGDFLWGATAMISSELEDVLHRMKNM